MVDENVTNYLLQLGLNRDEVKIYLSLIGVDRQRVQNIASKSSVAKTTVYRRLARLKQLGLVEEITEESTTYYRAADPSQLHLLLDNKAAAIESLTRKLPPVLDQLSQQILRAEHPTEVKFFRGIKGIQQMTWNILLGKGDVCGYSFRVFSEVGSKFSQDWSERFATSGRKARDLYSDAYVQSKQNSKEFSEKHHALWPNWQSRYINPNILTITHQEDIYDDVVTFYNWRGEDVFGIEIHNQEIADQHRQLFELAWNAAER